MSVFGNDHSSGVVAAAQRSIARMDDTQIAAAILRSDLWTSNEGRSALVEAVFDAFRDRGESSEDVAEGAATTLEAIRACEPDALRALVSYAQRNVGSLKEALCELFARRPGILRAFEAEFAGDATDRLGGR